MAERLEDPAAALARHLKWLAQLADVLEASAVRTRHKGLHRVCAWLVSEGELDANPMTGLDAPRPTDKPVPVLSDEEIAALLKACAGRDFRDRRDEAVIRLLLDCGCSPAASVSRSCGGCRSMTST